MILVFFFNFTGIIVDEEITKLVEDAFLFNVQCQKEDLEVVEGGFQFMGDAAYS